jgi:hypothetical protein
LSESETSNYFLLNKETFPLFSGQNLKDLNFNTDGTGQFHHSVPTYILKENWELCLHRLTHYQKVQYLNKKSDPTLDSNPDLNMINWIEKLKKAKDIIQLCAINDIIEIDDIDFIDQLSEIISNPSLKTL